MKRNNPVIGEKPEVPKVAISLWDMTGKKKYMTGYTVYGHPEAVRIAIEVALKKTFGNKK